MPLPRKAGAINGRWKWQLFGLLIGMVLTLAYLPDTSQIIRQQALQAVGISHEAATYAVTDHQEQGLLPPQDETRDRLEEERNSMQGYSFLLLMEIGLFGLIGILLSLHAYSHRFCAVSHRDWSRTEWQVVLGSVALGIVSMCLSCSLTAVLNPIASLLYLLVYVTAIRFLLTVFGHPSRQIQFGFNAFLITLIIDIYLLLYKYDCNFYRLIPYSSHDLFAPRWEYITLWTNYVFGIPLLLLPALCVYVLVVVNRVRYQPVAQGIARGFRAITLPIMSLLLVIYMLLVLGIVHTEQKLGNTPYTGIEMHIID